MIKNALKQIITRTIMRPPHVTHCSQTIYEALLACLRMVEAGQSDPWAGRADHVLDILLRIQQPDGGFDIGYEFNFGHLHLRGQSTSPELVGLLALTEYSRLRGGEPAMDAARRAVEWIRQHALPMGDGKYAIPYSPYTVGSIMVYNGTSFACGALGYYLGVLGGDDQLHAIYNGMVTYLSDVMTAAPDVPGRFWYYNDQTRANMDVGTRHKVDYYHQMQQVEMHSLAERVCPASGQREMIRDAADHVVALIGTHPVLPYTNDPHAFGGRIHLWGFASVVPGLLEAARVVPERAEIYTAAADDAARWVMRWAWTGTSFHAVLNPDGSSLDASPYMVRSDAWVLNAMAAAHRDLAPGPWGQALEPCYQTMAAHRFSGPESHASTPYLRFAGRTVKRLMRQ